MEFVAALAAQHNFDAVNLCALMQPYAERELLYFRDDDHLNRRGNEVVANLVREAGFRD